MSFDREFSDMPLLGLQGTRKRKQVHRDGMVDLSSWGHMSVTQIQMQFQAFDRTNSKFDTLPSNQQSNDLEVESGSPSVARGKKRRPVGKTNGKKTSSTESTPSRKSTPTLYDSGTVIKKKTLGNPHIGNRRSAKFTGLVKRPNCPKALKDVIATRSPADNNALNILVGRIIGKYWRKYGYYLGLCDHVNAHDGTMFVTFEDGDSDSLFLDDVLAMLMPIDALPRCASSTRNTRTLGFVWPPAACDSKRAIERERSRILEIVASQGAVLAATDEAEANNDQPCKRSPITVDRIIVSSQPSTSATPTSPPRTTQDLAAMAQHLMSRASQSPGHHRGSLTSSANVSPAKHTNGVDVEAKAPRPLPIPPRDTSDAVIEPSPSKRTPRSLDALTPTPSHRRKKKAKTCHQPGLSHTSVQTLHDANLPSDGQTSIADKPTPNEQSGQRGTKHRSTAHGSASIDVNVAPAVSAPPQTTKSATRGTSTSHVESTLVLPAVKAHRVVWTLLDGNNTSAQGIAREMSSTVFDYE
eukprot:m.985760 g.985760  ORF g.985760 m.985760 type:complete len:525 (-) comp23984_c0_seq13:3686-5260(-)